MSQVPVGSVAAGTWHEHVHAQGPPVLLLALLPVRPVVLRADCVPGLCAASGSRPRTPRSRRPLPVSDGPRQVALRAQCVAVPVGSVLLGSAPGRVRVRTVDGVQREVSHYYDTWRCEGAPQLPGGHAGASSG